MYNIGDTPDGPRGQSITPPAAARWSPPPRQVQPGRRLGPTWRRGRVVLSGESATSVWELVLTWCDVPWLTGPCQQVLEGMGVLVFNRLRLGHAKPVMDLG